MRKVLVLLLLLLTAPAMADITITLTENPANTIEVSYSSSDSNVPRGFGLDIDAIGDVNIVSVTDVDPNFRVYPTAIANDPCGQIGGSPVVGTLPAGTGNDIILEMATLYGTGDPCGFTSPPPTSALLCKINLDVPTGGKLRVSANAARNGIVMEDYMTDPCDNLPQEINLGKCFYVNRVFNKGITVTSAMYTTWSGGAVSEASCWCCEAQKYGNGAYGGASAGRVDTVDLGALKLSWFKRPGQAGYNACVDFGVGSGTNRVDTVDLGVLKQNWFSRPGSCTTPTW
jgi:hypothetical protein